MSSQYEMALKHVEECLEKLICSEESPDSGKYPNDKDLLNHLGARYCASMYLSDDVDINLFTLKSWRKIQGKDIFIIKVTFYDDEVKLFDYPDSATLDYVYNKLDNIMSYQIQRVHLLQKGEIK